jgi:hypothetical protein
MSDLTSKMAARVKSEPTRRAAEVFRSPADDMQRATLYLPRETLLSAKHAAISLDTSVSKVVTRLLNEWLATHSAGDVTT